MTNTGSAIVYLRIDPVDDQSRKFLTSVREYEIEAHPRRPLTPSIDRDKHAIGKLEQKERGRFERLRRATAKPVDMREETLRAFRRQAGSETDEFHKSPATAISRQPRSTS